MKLYIDDIREPSQEWSHAKTITEAISCIAMFGNEITEISLDHDISHQVRLGDVSRPYPCDETFQPVAYFIREYWSGTDEEDKPKITLHTANPVGAEAMESILNDFQVEIKLSKPCNRLEEQ